MSDSPSSSSDAPPPRHGRRRYRRPVVWIAGLAGLAVLALIGAALAPWSGGDSRARTTAFGVRRLAERSTGTNPLPEHVTKVFGSEHRAKTYGTIIAAQEDQGVDTHGQPASDLDAAFAPGVQRARGAATAATPSAGRQGSRAKSPTLKAALRQRRPRRRQAGLDRRLR